MPNIDLKQSLAQTRLAEIIGGMVSQLVVYLSTIKYLFPWYIYSLVSFSYLEVRDSNVSFC